MSRGMAARKRRGARRAVKRAEMQGLLKARNLDPVLAAAVEPEFPLSERTRAWEGAEADERWHYKCSDEDEYARGFFWSDEEEFKLPFVDVVEGEAKAIWRAVTAAAGALRGARGGVEIPKDDRPGVEAQVAAYYARARETFSDDAITPPWETSTVAEAAYALAYAETGKVEELVEREAYWLEELSAGKKGFQIWTTSNTATTNSANFDMKPNADLPSEHKPKDKRPRKNPGAKVPATEPRTNASQVRWEATLAPEGQLTDDGRMFAPGSINWRQLPLSLMVMNETSAEGHQGAWLGGRIDRIWRDNNQIRAEGVFTDDENGHRAAKLVAEGALKGVSVDIAVKEYEVAYKTDLFDAEGILIWPQPEKDQSEAEPNLLEILFADETEEKPVFVLKDGVIGAATVCPFPAFADATIALSASGLIWNVRLQGGFTLVQEKVEVPEEDAEALTAAAAGMAPLVPPMEWFENPVLGELTPLTVSDEGRVYGHAAAWDTCHIGLSNACTVAPHSDTDYSLFHLGAVKVDTGDDVPIGKITLGTGHAAKHLDWQGAASHYDDTGTVVADIACGEDDYGIWVNGALRPDIPAERVRELRAAVLSGDWRAFNGNLELVALLAVNVPGFPIPRKRALVAAGENSTEVLTLVAAGINTGLPEPSKFTAGDLERFKVLAGRAKAEDYIDYRAQLALLAARAGGTDYRAELAKLAELARRPFVAKAETFYSEDQPRDDHGRWDGGGGSSGKGGGGNDSSGAASPGGEFNPSDSTPAQKSANDEAMTNVANHVGGDSLEAVRNSDGGMRWDIQSPAGAFYGDEPKFYGVVGFTATSPYGHTGWYSEMPSDIPSESFPTADAAVMDVVAKAGGSASVRASAIDYRAELARLAEAARR